MRAKLKTKPLLGALAGHFTMGVAVGLLFALILTMIEQFGVRELVLQSPTPRATMIVFIGTFMLMFGIGATLTGLVFIMMDQTDDHAR
jgi:ABC-type multidrug transport system permease subunit